LSSFIRVHFHMNHILLRIINYFNINRTQANKNRSKRKETKKYLKETKIYIRIVIVNENAF
ncbi:MAG: hypothetical protein L0I92_04105, partial [Staphylococcus equorum]|nr:hypothetical protein [Staphylococcus equorum]